MARAEDIIDSIMQGTQHQVDNDPRWGKVHVLLAEVPVGFLAFD